MGIGNKKKSVYAEDRRYKAFELKRGGMSYRRIGQQLGCSRTQAQRDVFRVLRELRPAQEDIDFYRNLLLGRYEFILEKLFPKLDSTTLTGESAVYDRILKTLNQIADIVGVKEKKIITEQPQNDLSSFAELLRQADSQ